ncbi:MAG TPA: ATP-binding cassette domain-containing protein, partial [Gemmatimonadaceae bacterium]|nr:ATP-binding cassette domain-containing protein [Gemmatimonadaceae bacterium]
MSATALLRADRLTVRIGPIAILSDLSFSVDAGQVLGVIGPNGAGKTTAFNCITGFYRPHRGRVLYRGQDVTSLPPHRKAAMGFGRTFQNVGMVK